MFWLSYCLYSWIIQWYCARDNRHRLKQWSFTFMSLYRSNMTFNITNRGEWSPLYQITIIISIHVTATFFVDGYSICSDHTLPYVRTSAPHRSNFATAFHVILPSGEYRKTSLIPRQGLVPSGNIPLLERCNYKNCTCDISSVLYVPVFLLFGSTDGLLQDCSN